MAKFRDIYCCACSETVQARLINGAIAYPHRPDLKSLPFWRCDTCGNFVGCHHKTKNRTNPLGHIPTPEIRKARSHIHAILDPIWQSGRMKRRPLYAEVSKRVGWRYHTAKIKTIEEAREIYRVVRELSREVYHGN